MNVHWLIDNLIYHSTKLCANQVELSFCLVRWVNRVSSTEYTRLLMANHLLSTKLVCGDPICLDKYIFPISFPESQNITF